VKTPVRAPRANAVCERFIGSLKRECLDHRLTLNQRHLHRTVKEYVGFYKYLRPHQGLRQHIPVPIDPDIEPLVDGDNTKITSTAILGGLHHSYSRVPDLHLFSGFRRNRRGCRVIGFSVALSRPPDRFFGYPISAFIASTAPDRTAANLDRVRIDSAGKR
jgi:hypothetical protein